MSARRVELSKRGVPAGAVNVGPGTPWMLNDDHTASVADLRSVIADPRSNIDFVLRCRAELAGRNLACTCNVSSECHADWLVLIANRRFPDEVEAILEAGHACERCGGPWFSEGDAVHERNGLYYRWCSTCEPEFTSGMFGPDDDGREAA